MNFDSEDDHLSDSSIYGWDNKATLRAVDATLEELVRKKKANMPKHMHHFLRERRRVRFSDLFDESGCNDVESVRNRLRQVRVQLAMQKQLVDKERNRSLELAKVRKQKDEFFLATNPLTLSDDSSLVFPRPQIQISVPQHFSRKLSQRQKSEGVTAWDGSQYMLSLLFSLRDKLLVKFCFLFLQDRSKLWIKKKEVAEKMYESKCQMLVNESFAGLKVSWLQVIMFVYTLIECL